MQVSNPLLAALPVLSVPSTAASVKSWQVGQLLQAIVVSAKSAQLATLLIGNTRVDASTPRPLIEGQQLQLEVAQTGKSTLLKVLNAPPQENAVNAALRQTLPKQEPLQPLLQTLVKLNKEPLNSKERINDSVKSLIQTLTRSFSTPIQLSTPQGLKQSVMQSGVFLESKLAQALSNKAAQIPEGDLKANLLKLADQLRSQEPATAKKTADVISKPVVPSSHASNPPTAAQVQRLLGGTPAPVPITPNTNSNLLGSKNLLPPSVSASKLVAQTSTLVPAGTDPAKTAITNLMQQIESAVARIQTHQLTAVTHVTAEERTLPQWTLELPVLAGDQAETVRLEIQQGESSSGTDNKESTWTITLQFDFEKIGKLSARVTLSGEQVSTVFFTNENSTQQRIKDNLSWLQQRLEQAGLEILNLSAIAGDLTNSMPAPLRQFLLNEKA